MPLSKLTVHNVEDHKGAGLWVQSYNPEPYVQYVTRAGDLWRGVTRRCKEGGKFQTKQPTYVGVTNGFKDFQEFAEWCQQQYGYMSREENDYFWQLDKDLKVFGNRVYSPETCIFVPARVNSLLVSNAALRGELPLGVSFKAQVQKFQSDCNNGKGKVQYLGIFVCKQEAHQAWQRYKIDLIRKICVEDEEIRNHLELVPILLAQAQRIEDDLNNGRETM